MIGCTRVGALRDCDIIGTRHGNRTRGGNRTRAVERFLAVRFLVANHDDVTCVAACVVRKSPRQVGC